jgi:hypothetical protein
MAGDQIQASVGMYNDGTTNCYNLPQDVATIIGLLNSIADSDGGTGGANSLDPSASPGQLFRAILNFQKTQDDTGRTPRLSVDGHVDPAGATLARLIEIARRVKPKPPSPATLQVIPFNEPTPLLIARKPHDLTKSDLENSPSTPTLPSGLTGMIARRQLSNKRGAKTSDLEGDMQAELLLGAGVAGAEILSDFIVNSAAKSTITKGVGSALAKRVQSSTEFTDANNEVKQFVTDALSESAATGILDYHILRAENGKVPPPQFGFSGLDPLHFVIGSIQGSNVFLEDFSADAATRSYRAVLSYEFFDHFGADDSDLIPNTSGHGSPGQVALWVLQRERHPGHQPFVVKVVMEATIIDKF